VDEGLLALLVEAAFGGEISDRVVIGYVDFVLLSNHSVEMGGEDVAKTSSDHHYIIFFEVVGSGFSLFAEAQRVAVSREELLGCDLSHRKHNNQLISDHFIYHNNKLISLLAFLSQPIGCSTQYCDQQHRDCKEPNWYKELI
jgi:hypothetical protein